MISLKPVEFLPPEVATLPQRKRSIFRSLMWLCLCAACVGASWFSYQCVFVPQPRSFAADWQHSQWVQAPDATSPVAYFRYETAFSGQPDSAFVTVTANHVFRLYMNGYYIGSNASDFVAGVTSRSYLYDVSVALRPGTNAIGLRVTNLDNHVPQVRANIGMMWGKILRYSGTGSGWLATGQTSLVHPLTQDLYAWTQPSFDASQWHSAQQVNSPPASPPSKIDPQVYKQPLPSHWLSAGNDGQEGYFVRHISMPASFHEAILRVITTGETQIFINDHLYSTWHGQVPVPQKNIASDVSNQEKPVSYRKGLVLGAYDVSAYLHPGQNTIAVHIVSPGSSAANVGLEALKNAMSLDMLVSTGGTYTTPLASDSSWHAATHPAIGWTHEESATLNWAPPTSVGPPGRSRIIYLPDSNTPQNDQGVPLTLLCELILWSVGGVLACWVLMSLVVLRRYYRSRRDAFEVASLAFLPALAAEAVLLVLEREPLLPQPFPYSWPWAAVLVGLVVLASLLLWLHARKSSSISPKEDVLEAGVQRAASPLPGIGRACWGQDQAPNNYFLNGFDIRFTFPFSLLKRGGKVQHFLVRHWGMLLILLLAIPMVSYHLGYEPYWQDELSSYYAARGIMAHGFPMFPSGILYPKGELFSYLMALMMTIWGGGHGIPRMISLLEYLVSLPLLYALGCSWFNRRVAWLATAMLALSPYALLWGRQARMYEQALLIVIVVMYTFQRALQQRHRARPIYLAVFCLLLAYFSHEEIFIILPALVVCVLIESRDGPYGLPAVMRNKHWWFAALIGGVIIATQLAVVYFYHPRLVGTDQSMRPQIQLTAANIPYYFNLLFQPSPYKDGIAPWTMARPLLVVNSLLAILGGIWALRSRETKARFCALFLLLSTLTLAFVFTMQADRYFYPLLPAYYLLGSYALWKTLHALWVFARPHLLSSQSTPDTPGTSRQLSLPMRIALTGIAASLCACVLLVPLLPVSSYNLFISRITGLSYHRHYPDYDNAAQYIHNHWRKGDIVVTVAPAVSILYYVGQADDYFSVDRALFVFEQNGHLIETTSGSHPLLNQADFQALLASHARIWLISDGGSYQAGVTKNARFNFPPPDFRPVYEGYGSEVFFR